MTHRRLPSIAILALILLVFQFAPLGNNVGVAAAARCNSAAFVSDVTVPDGTTFSPGAAFVKTWRLKNTGTCTWTSAYQLAFVSGDPLGATTSMTMPTTAPGQTVDFSFDMNAPTTPGHYRGYWMLKDPQGIKFGLGINADQPFWVDINVSGAAPTQPSVTSTPTPGLNLQGTVKLNGAGLAGVKIYRSFASYSGVLVATTGADGKYKADFVFIPGDEMVTVWAELAGYTFEPDRSFWRHYYGVENATRDFTAIPASTTPQPTPPTGLMLQGTVRLNGAGLAGVRIYRSYAAYPGTLVATTGADGSYDADFMPIPGRETVTVWAELAGYTFNPANYNWLHEHSFESKTLDFTAAGAPTAPPPTGGTVFDFTQQVCAARWRSGAGELPCQGSDGDARGLVRKLDSPRLENGVVDSAPGLLVVPQNKYNGYIQGFFPEYTVQPGDRFRASVGCAYGSSCYVTYRLDYQINNGAINILWSWQEKNEGKIYQLDKDLSALAGKKVSFILTLLATGSATNDRALWGQPRIVHAGGSIPTTPPPITTVPTTVTPPTVSPPPSSGTVLDFVTDACSASWKSGAGTLPCPGTDGDARGFVLPITHPKFENGATDSAGGLILFPQNQYNGYIQGTYPEFTVQKGDRFQGIVNCAYGSSCYVTFRLDYETAGITPRVFWSWQEKNEGQFYAFDKDLSALAGKKVKFTLTLLATGPATGDRALWGHPRIVRTGTVSPTPSTPQPPADTPIANGKVTNATVSVKIPEFVNCASSLSAELLGNLTTDGRATVKYHWEISGTNNYTTSEDIQVFFEGETLPVSKSISLGCGSYTAKLVVTSPNAITGQVDFSLSKPTVLPIYDFSTFKAIGTMNCNEVTNYAWRQEACNAESGGCWISQTPLFGNNYAGFFRHDGNTICGMNIP